MHSGAPVRKAVAQAVARRGSLLALIMVAAWFSVATDRWRSLVRSIRGSWAKGFLLPAGGPLSGFPFALAPCEQEGELACFSDDGLVI